MFCHLLFRYVYELEASTAGGTGVSDQYVIQTPSSCPTGIQPPYRVTVLGPHSVSLAWTPPGKCLYLISHLGCAFFRRRGDININATVKGQGLFCIREISSHL